MKSERSLWSMVLGFSAYPLFIFEPSPFPPVSRVCLILLLEVGLLGSKLEINDLSGCCEK